MEVCLCRLALFSSLRCADLPNKMNSAQGIVVEMMKTVSVKFR